MGNIGWSLTYSPSLFCFIYRRPENLLPSIFIAAITILYALLVTKSKRMDRREKKKTGYIFLQDSAPPSHQLYAVVVDTGFRAPARFTAKVPGHPGDTCGCGRCVCRCGRMAWRCGHLFVCPVLETPGKTTGQEQNKNLRFGRRER